MSASHSHATGIHFDNRYESEGLAHILEVLMQHQNLFALPQNLGRRGLLQIGAPKEKESKAAAASMSDAFDRVKSLAEPKPAQTMVSSNGPKRSGLNAQSTQDFLQHASEEETDADEVAW
jgi:hypothetical protein